ncbi:MAG: TrbI/VirB10 family protein [Pseudomonadota bacterium]
MSDTPDPALEARLETFRKKRPGPARGGPSVTLIAVLLGLAAGGLAFVLSSLLAAPEDRALVTSDVADFQSTGRAAEIAFPEAAPLRPAPPPIEVPEPDGVDVAALAPGEIVLTDPSVARELERIRAALRDAEAERRRALAAAERRHAAELRARETAVTDRLEAAFAEERQALEDRLAEIEADRRRARASEAQERRELEAELARAQSARDALERQVESLTALTEAGRLASLAAEDARKAEEIRRAEAAALAQRRHASAAVIFAGSAAMTAGGVDAELDPTADEAFLRQAPRVGVAEAGRIAEPGRTLLQGTVIQATLRTAINSDLPGNALAIVSEPVLAFSGERVLIPKGSQLFGSYSARIDTHQRRILVRWSRIVTPAGISMEIAAVGGDPLGRSGLSGFVDTRLDERLSGGVLISLIGALPSVAVRSLEGEVARDTAVAMTEGVAATTDSVLAEQLSIRPTLYADQGAAVTVIVDRDVVVHDS